MNRVANTTRVKEARQAEDMFYAMQHPDFAGKMDKLMLDFDKWAEECPAGMSVLPDVVPMIPYTTFIDTFRCCR